MNREEALSLLKQNVTQLNLLKHCYAVEAIMKGAARHLNEDENMWSLTGLLHDIDFEKIVDPKEHAIIAEGILKGKVDDVMIRAIKSHNFEHTNVTPIEKMELALIAADSISGLIVACALVMPSKKLADVRTESISKRFKAKDFARNCSRENMLYCEKIGIDRDKFFEIALSALQGISNELGL